MVIQAYIKDSTLPYVDVEIKNVILDDLRQSPYSARIEFEKVFTNPANHSELKTRAMDRERHLRLSREREEQRVGHESSWADHRALPRGPGVQLNTKQSAAS